MHHKPFSCPRCRAGFKTIQGLRGHERFRHGINASPARRYWTEDGEIVPAGPGLEGMTFKEALDQAHWEILNERLGQVEAGIKEILLAIRTWKGRT